MVPDVYDVDIAIMHTEALLQALHMSVFENSYERTLEKFKSPKHAYDFISSLFSQLLGTVHEAREALDQVEVELAAARAEGVQA